VHLAGKADARDGVGGDAAFQERRPNRLLTRPPPVTGILLGAEPRRRPSSPSNTARVPPVPTSIPRTGMIDLPDED